jgi:hypothetical protein
MMWVSFITKGNKQNGKRLVELQRARKGIGAKRGPLKGIV